MNQESSNLDHKLERYACLKLGLLRVWMHLMQNAWRCVNACDYGSCCLCLLIKRILPPFGRPKNVGIVDSWIAFDATLISHQQHQGTHLFGLDSSEYSMQHTHLLFFTPFQFFSMSFHCVRPLLYKGHSLDLLINQWIRFWVYEKCELENSPH